MNQLKPDFLIELAKTCIVDKHILELIKPHLAFGFIDQEALKHVFKYIFDYHSAHNAAPSIGLVAQNVQHPSALEVIGQIRQTVTPYDKKDQIVETFEEFIKKARFLKVCADLEEYYNKGQHDEAFNFGYKEFAEINAFSLKNNRCNRIYADFDERQMARAMTDHVRRKVPLGIPAFDYHSRGGCDLGTGLLAIARSGVGKTTLLRQIGASASFYGYNVLHLASGDSPQKDVDDGYDSWWTGVKLSDIREGTINPEIVKKIEKSRESYVANCGEIYTYSFNQFDTASIRDCRSILVDLLKTTNIQVVLFDYLEQFSPGDKSKYGTDDASQRAKKLATAEKIINIATEFDVFCATVTQASDVPYEIWNDPTKVLTRSNISNLKATINPFAWCITLNQTKDEDDNELMRIHEEKMRHYKTKSWERTYTIVQKRDVGRFIDLAATNKRFWDVEKKEVIRNIIKKEVVKKEKVTDKSVG